jgi:hypothetical protein
MRNKIVGTITDPDDVWGRRIAIDKGIIKFLIRGDKTLGELRILVAQHNPQPEYTKMGVLKVLERLKKKVRKHKPRGERYPKYSLTDSALRDITIQANLFSIDASKKVLNEYHVDQNNIDSFLEELVRGIGVYTLFNYFHSFKFTSTKYSHKQNMEKRQAWIQQTIPMQGLSWIIERAFDRFMPDKDYMRKIFEDEKSMKFLSEFEDKLQKSFPEEFDKCKEVLDNLNKKTTIHNKWLSDLDELEQWRKECDSKNKRNFKKKLKINECPRCHNDGSFPTPKGTCKGKIFDCGFYLEHLPDTPQERRYCPSCGYRGTHEEYRKLILRK